MALFLLAIDLLMFSTTTGVYENTAAAVLAVGRLQMSPSP